MKPSLLAGFILMSLFCLSSQVDPLLFRPADAYPLGETLEWKKGEDNRLTLLPLVSGAGELMADYTSYSPEITVQRLYRFPLPDDLSGNSRESLRGLFTRIVNILGRPETLVGYTYRSSTRNEEISLFEGNYIANEKGKRTDNFSYSESTLPEALSYYQMVDEANFSETLFFQNITIGPDYLRFTSTNRERIWLKFLPLLGAGQTRTDMLMFVHEGFLYTFSSTQIEKVPTMNKLGISVNIPSMFRKRMDVMGQWLEEELK